MGKVQTRAQWDVSHEFVDTIRESERKALAHALHDTVMQPLAALITSLECMQYQPPSQGVSEAYIGAWKDLVREAMDSLRGALAGLSEHPHAELGLPEALRRYLAPQLWSQELRLTLDITRWPEDLPLGITTSLYLIVREALTNVAKHAQASQIRVQLRASSRLLTIIISDDGIGLESDALLQDPRPAGGGLGIESMRARVQALGGKLAFSTAPGQGVRITIQVPHLHRAPCPH